MTAIPVVSVGGKCLGRLAQQAAVRRIQKFLWPNLAMTQQVRPQWATYPQCGRSQKRLGEKPFVLLGVNSDTDRQALKVTLVDEKLPWRPFLTPT